MGRFTGILGLLTMLVLAYAFSTNRRAIRLKTVAWGLGLQFVFAIFVLRIEAGRVAFQKAGDAVNRLLSYAFVGSQFVFGELGKQGSHLDFYFAFQVLPTIIFIAACSHSDRTDKCHDQRHGARLPRNHGGLHRVWHRAETLAERGNYDRSRHATHGEDAGTRDR